MPLDWGGNASPDDRGNPFNRDILGGVSFDDLIYQLQMNAALSGTNLDDTVAYYDQFGRLVVRRSHTPYGPIQGITPVPHGMQINRGDSTYRGSFGAGGGGAGTGTGSTGGAPTTAAPTQAAPGAQPGFSLNGGVAGSTPGSYTLGGQQALGGVPNFYATSFPGTAGISTAPTGFGLGSQTALGGTGSSIGAIDFGATTATAQGASWADRARQAWDAYQQYGGAIGGLAGGGGGGGFGGAGGGGPLVTPPPPPDFSQSAPYQRGLANLLGVLGVQGSPITWPQFQGAPR